MNRGKSLKFFFRVFLFFSLIKGASLFAFEPHPAHLMTQKESDPAWSLSLNGEWLFAPKFTDGLIAGSGKLEPVPVPSQWQQLGYEIPLEQSAWYSKEVTIPAQWKGRALRLRFDSVYSSSVVYLNGIETGSHEGGFVPFEIDLTPHVAAGGKVRIGVKVTSASEADMLMSGNQYAAHSLGGINRKVTLFSVPQRHIRRVRLDVNQINFEKKVAGKALLELYGEISGSLKAEGSLSIRLTPMDYEKITGVPAGFTPGALSTSVDLDEVDLIPFEGGFSFRLPLVLENPALWNAEQPFRYQIELELAGGDEAPHRLEWKQGLRKVEISGRRLLVNGTKVLLRGANRHEAHPLTGRVLTPELAWLDAQLFKEANCNFIRTSHYPPMEEFLEACEEIGLYVEIESPLCWIGHGANANWKKLDYRDKRWLPYQTALNRSTFYYSERFGSPLFRSLANESLWSNNWDQVHRQMKKEFPGELLVFHDQCWGLYNNQGSDAALANYHYPGPDGVRLARLSGNRPVLFGEYTHLNVYNRREVLTDPSVREGWGEALYAMWNTMEQADWMVGGAIWSGIDDLFLLPDGRSVGYGPWGIIDGWRRKKPEFWMTRKSYSPVRVRWLDADSNPAGRRGGRFPAAFEVENRHQFLDLGDLRFEVKAGEFVACPEVSAAPGTASMVQMNLPSELSGELLLSIYNGNRLVDRYRFVREPLGLNAPCDCDEDGLLSPDGSIFQVRESGESLIFSASETTWELNRMTGSFVSVTRRGQKERFEGPDLMVSPLTSEECFPEYRNDIEPINQRAVEAGSTKVRWQEKKGTMEISVRKKYREAGGSYRILLKADGSMETSWKFRMRRPINPRQVGIVYSFDDSMNRISWEREGFFSWYPASHIGRNSGFAVAFPDDNGDPVAVEARVSAFKPALSPAEGSFGAVPAGDLWALDAHSLGCRDFRATRTGVRSYRLEKPGFGVEVVSDGTLSCRSWLEEGKTFLLSAAFHSPGYEIFLQSHLTHTRDPLVRGERIEGHQLLRIR